MKQIKYIGLKFSKDELPKLGDYLRITGNRDIIIRYLGSDYQVFEFSEGYNLKDNVNIELTQEKDGIRYAYIVLSTTEHPFIYILTEDEYNDLKNETTN